MSRAIRSSLQAVGLGIIVIVAVLAWLVVVPLVTLFTTPEVTPVARGPIGPPDARVRPVPTG